MHRVVKSFVYGWAPYYNRTVFERQRRAFAVDDVLVEMKIVKTLEQTPILLRVAQFNKARVPRKGEQRNQKLIETKKMKTAEQTWFLLDSADINKALIVQGHQPRVRERSVKQKLRKPRNKAVFIEYQ